MNKDLRVLGKVFGVEKVAVLFFSWHVFLKIILCVVTEHLTGS